MHCFFIGRDATKFFGIDPLSSTLSHLNTSFEIFSQFYICTISQNYQPLTKTLAELERRGVLNKLNSC